MRIAQVSPSEIRVQRLMAAADALLNRLYPPESNRLAGVERLQAPDVSLYGAFRQRQLVGIAALFAHCQQPGEYYGELKRLYVVPAARRSGVAGHLVGAIEARARVLGLRKIMLEAGARQLEVSAFYRRLGYRQRPPFGNYPDHVHSVFWEKFLS